MTISRIKFFKCDLEVLDVASDKEIRLKNWPIVYILNDKRDIYIGETCSAISRMTSHKSSMQKTHFREVRIILDDKFNKSACHDLESHLIKYFHADGKFRVLNGNAGISDSDYFDRPTYRKSFEYIFERLKVERLITRSIPELENTNIFKYSPFKALSLDQADAIKGIVRILLPPSNRVSNKLASQKIVVQGGPGTGKTIVAVFLMKLIRDIALNSESEALEIDSVFSDFFQSGYKNLFMKWKIGLVIPQQSLRQTIQKVFKSIPGLSKEMILSPFDVGKSAARYNLLIVDEAHRLKIRSNMSSAGQNRSFREINQRLFKSDADHITQLDWIIAQSDSQILLIDSAQSVMPADLTLKAIQDLEKQARNDKTYFSLKSQLRVRGGEEYITYISQVLEGNAETKIKHFKDYDCCIFDSIHEMRKAIKKRNQEKGLARVVAGYAWPWATRGKSDPTLYDIEIDGLKLSWNRTDKDWINSLTSIDEVGSIHTVQGYDLNYCGVIVGPDLKFDIATQSIVFNRDNYYDKKGRENNRRLGIIYTDDQLFVYVKQIYRVLLTRAIFGTYIYVCDPALKNYLSKFFPSSK